MEVVDELCFTDIQFVLVYSFFGAFENSILRATEVKW